MSLCVRTLVWRVCGIIAVLMLAFSGRAIGTRSQEGGVAPRDRAAESRIRDGYGVIPLGFEANRGQVDSSVDALARGFGYTVYLSPQRTVVALSRTRDRAETAALAIHIGGANRNARLATGESLPGTVNYFIGNDPQRWRIGIPTYSTITYEDVYRGIDVVYYGNNQQLEYDFVVHPGGDPEAITLQFEGADSLNINADGDLDLGTGGESIRMKRPIAYQDIHGTRHPVSSRYVRTARGDEIKIALAAYDTNHTVVIDPVLVYSTFLGGGGSEQALNIAVDAAGNSYVTGLTDSANFPTTVGAFETLFQGGVADAFVTKLNPSGTSVVYSTYLGGSSFDVSGSVAIDVTGSAYVTGTTDSLDFPTTVGAAQPTYRGGVQDSFVTKLSATGGTLVYSTYLGGSGQDSGTALAIDAAGSVYATGLTNSSNFPATLLAFQAANAGGAYDVYVSKLDPLGSTFLYSTYLGGSDQDQGQRIAVDLAGNAYVTGLTRSGDFPTMNPFQASNAGGIFDAFVTKLNPLGTTLVYSTYLGGSGDDTGFGLAVDIAGSAYVGGSTASITFPVTAGAFQTGYGGGSADAFMAKFSVAGNTLVYSTFVGGGNLDQCLSLAIDAAGRSYCTGITRSGNFPTVNAVQSALGGGDDAFATTLNAAGTALVDSTFLGASGQDQGNGIAVDSMPAPNVYVAGRTTSAGFPTTPGAFQVAYAGGSSDAFVLKIGAAGVPASLTLDPPAATNPVDSKHCVTATVRDASFTPVPGVTVRFSVSGSVNTTGQSTTDANGEATFCYLGPALPGQDAITAFADTNNDSALSPGEPSGAATKTWLPPATTPLCEIKITNGGRIKAANGDKATFGGYAKASRTGDTSGEEQYQDHGPAQPLTVRSIAVLAIVCEGTTDASIYGQAKINGAGSFAFRIKVHDGGEPGIGVDTYGITLQNGYDSGQQILLGGNVQVRREQ